MNNGSDSTETEEGLWCYWAKHKQSFGNEKNKRIKREITTPNGGKDAKNKIRVIKEKMDIVKDERIGENVWASSSLIRIKTQKIIRVIVKHFKWKIWSYD